MAMAAHPPAGLQAGLLRRQAGGQLPLQALHLCRCARLGGHINLAEAWQELQMKVGHAAVDAKPHERRSQLSGVHRAREDIGMIAQLMRQHRGAVSMSTARWASHLPLRGAASRQAA